MPATGIPLRIYHRATRALDPQLFLRYYLVYSRIGAQGGRRTYRGLLRPGGLFSDAGVLRLGYTGNIASSQQDLAGVFYADDLVVGK